MKLKRLTVLILTSLTSSLAVLMGNCVQQAEAPTQTITDVSAQEAFDLI